MHWCGRTVASSCLSGDSQGAWSLSSIACSFHGHAMRVVLHGALLGVLPRAVQRRRPSSRRAPARNALTTQHHASQCAARCPRSFLSCSSGFLLLLSMQASLSHAVLSRGPLSCRASLMSALLCSLYTAVHVQPYRASCVAAAAAVAAPAAEGGDEEEEGEEEEEEGARRCSTKGAETARAMQVKRSV